jgi:hypothetical protein
MSINYSSDVITSGSDEDTITINSSTLDDIMHSTMSTSLNYSINSSGTIGTAGLGNYTFTTDGTGYAQPWVTTTGVPHTLDVKGDANFEGDIKFKGRSLEELFSKIEDRLAILQPDPAKLEKYEALRKAYEHYKLMEKLIGEE